MSDSDSEERRQQQAEEWARLEGADGSGASADPESEGESGSAATGKKGSIKKKRRSSSSKKKSSRKEKKAKTDGPFFPEAHRFYAEELEIDDEARDAAAEVKPDKGGLFARMWNAVMGTSLDGSLREEKERIIEVSKVPFGRTDETEANAQRVLVEVWRELGMGESAPARIGPHWDQIGFQGQDPATDLRAAGSLALVQLLYYVQSFPDRAKASLKLSHDKKQDFPLSVVSVNFTKAVLDMVVDGKLNAVANRTGSLWQASYDLHAAALDEFTRRWKEGKCTIADFDPVQKKIRSDLAKDPGGFVARLYADSKPRFTINDVQMPK